MQGFWNGLTGIAKVLIISVACLFGLFMLSTCTMFGTLMNV